MLCRQGSLRYDVSDWWRTSDYDPRADCGRVDPGLKDLTAIHHQVGNYLVTTKGDEADVFCYGIALHHLPDRSGLNTKMVVGSYNFHLEKQKKSWYIDRFRFNLKFIDGNVNPEPDAENQYR